MKKHIEGHPQADTGAEPTKIGSSKSSSMNYLVTHGSGRKTLENITLRPLLIKDLDEVAQIDFSLLGKQRKEYWENKLERIEESGVPSLAAEINGKVIGFI
ncbi:MAG: hypothetical protein NTX75_00505, partial [Proteobacteria bacterium]|nr:hypothetical protein [Pseudomonadota bacterium]